MWERDFSIQSKALYPGSGSVPLAVAGFYGLSCFPPPPELSAMCFPSAKAFGGVRMKPELLPALPKEGCGLGLCPHRLCTDLPKPVLNT